MLERFTLAGLACLVLWAEGLRFPGWGVQFWGQDEGVPGFGVVEVDFEF